jgi:hypothetical protein
MRDYQKGKGDRGSVLIAKITVNPRVRSCYRFSTYDVSSPYYSPVHPVPLYLVAGDGEISIWFQKDTFDELFKDRC